MAFTEKPIAIRKINVLMIVFIIGSFFTKIVHFEAFVDEKSRNGLFLLKRPGLGEPGR